MKLFSFDLCVQYFPTIIRYLPVTLRIAAVSALLGLLLGTLAAAVRIFHIPVLEQILAVLTSFLRAVPPNVLLLMIFFAIPFLLQDLCMQLFHFNINRMDLYYYVIIAYTIMNSAFFSEMIRAAVLGVDRGQTEAAYAVGMSGRQAFLRIVFPQAFRIALPEFGNILINIVKNTSLAYLVGVVDLMGAVNLASVRTFHPLEGYVDVACLYLIISLLLERAFKALSFAAGSY